MSARRASQPTSRSWFGAWYVMSAIASLAVLTGGSLLVPSRRGINDASDALATAEPAMVLGAVLSAVAAAVPVPDVGRRVLAPALLAALAATAPVWALLSVLSGFDAVVDDAGADSVRVWMVSAAVAATASLVFVLRACSRMRGAAQRERQR